MADAAVSQVIFFAKHCAQLHINHHKIIEGKLLPRPFFHLPFHELKMTDGKTGKHMNNRWKIVRMTYVKDKSFQTKVPTYRGSLTRSRGWCYVMLSLRTIRKGYQKML